MSDKKPEKNKIKQELAEMTEIAKRAMADLQNLRRRQEEERNTLITMAGAGLISEILPILDNLERARQHVPEAAKDWAQGIEMCVNQLNKIFENNGLQVIETVGQPFNPDLHEALIQGPGDKDIIIEELEKGYMLGKKVLRHAKVKVGNGEKS